MYNQQLTQVQLQNFEYNAVVFCAVLTVLLTYYLVCLLFYVLHIIFLEIT